MAKGKIIDITGVLNKDPYEEFIEEAIEATADMDFDEFKKEMITTFYTFHREFSISRLIIFVSLVLNRGRKKSMNMNEIAEMLDVDFDAAKSWATANGFSL
jgi:hypothetical protein